MQRFPTAAVAAALILTFATPLLGSRRWFPKNIFGKTLIAIGGASIGIILWIANMPPKWFSGSALGFTIGLTLMASAFGFRTSEERFYRIPYLFSFGAVLVAANIWAHVR